MAVFHVFAELDLIVWRRTTSQLLSSSCLRGLLCPLQSSTLVVLGPPRRRNADAHTLDPTTLQRTYTCYKPTVSKHVQQMWCRNTLTALPSSLYPGCWVYRPRGQQHQRYVRRDLIAQVHIALRCNPNNSVCFKLRSQPARHGLFALCRCQPRLHVLRKKRVRVRCTCWSHASTTCTCCLTVQI